MLKSFKRLLFPWLLQSEFWSKMNDLNNKDGMQIPEKYV